MPYITPTQHAKHFVTDIYVLGRVLCGFISSIAIQKQSKKQAFAVNCKTAANDKAAAVAMVYQALKLWGQFRFLGDLIPYATYNRCPAERKGNQSRAGAAGKTANKSRCTVKQIQQRYSNPTPCYPLKFGF